MCLVKAVTGTWVRFQHVPEHLMLSPACCRQPSLALLTQPSACLIALRSSRQCMFAAGNHPLQRRFRAATAELLGKYGVPVSKQTKAELEAESDGSEKEGGSGQPTKSISISGRPPSCYCTGPLCLLQHTHASDLELAARPHCCCPVLLQRTTALTAPMMVTVRVQATLMPLMV